MKSIIQGFEKILEFGGIKKDIVFLVISAIALIISIFDLLPLSFDVAWIAILLCGLPIIFEAIIGIITEFDIKADVLVSIALVAAIFIGEDFAAGEVAFIMQLGALLENITVSKAREGIEKLVHLTPQTARVINGDSENIISAMEVNKGNIIRVLPGETIPVDGTIISGQTAVNQAVMTGESMPVDKTIGDEVSSGTVNQFGVFEMVATKVGEDSSIQRMIRLVQSADAGKAKIVGVADKWATWIVVIALVSATLTWMITGEIIRAVTILVVFCPCALVLATPTAIMAGIGNATKHGFLIREGDALERLAKVTKIGFDKTGTLSYGIPKVRAINSYSKLYSRDILYGIVASVEQYSEHPLGKAIVTCYKEEFGGELKKCIDFKMIIGQGVEGKIDRRKILVGNEKMFCENNIKITDQGRKEIDNYLKLGCTVVNVAIDNQFIGFAVLSDTVREESKNIVCELSNLGVQSVLLTGDHEDVAHTIALQVGIPEVYANCLPEDKLKHIERYQEKQEEICMIGDGVNDAPGLKKANVGIAMGGIGSDIAVDAADIVLVDDEVKELPHLIGLSKKMMKTIKCNLSFSMGLNFLAIFLAMAGILNPVVGALVHNAGSVIVIVNSALLLKWRRRSNFY